jgi:hypothetical protein
MLKVELPFWTAQWGRRKGVEAAKLSSTDVIVCGTVRQPGRGTYNSDNKKKKGSVTHRLQKS